MRTHRRTRRLAIAVAVAGSMVALGVPFAGAAKDDLTLVSRQSASDGGFGADGPSTATSISGDGRYVAFNSDANNLSSAANPAVTNTFVRDLQTNQTVLVSRQTAGAGADGGSSSVPGISADGRYITFASEANNLVVGENEAVTNVFVRDTQTNTTSLVSRASASDGGAAADAGSFESSISGDGRYVAFRSHGDNLSTADADVSNIFVRDLQTNSTTLVSRESGAVGPGGDDSSFSPAISADGRYVVFTSGANNLSTAASPAVENTFVRDLQTNSTILISRQSASDGGAGANGDTLTTPSISADGRFVAFNSAAANLATGTAPGSIFVRDTQANTTSLVSRQSAGDGGAPADAASGALAMSADGRYVAFDSQAENLSSADIAADDVFVRDLQTATTTLVSRRGAAEGGAPADGPSSGPAISASGRFVAFSSLANNLSGLDSDGLYDVFVYDYLGEPQAETPPGDTPPADTPPGGTGDATDPDLSSSTAKSKQKLGKALKVTVTSNEDAAVTATATATPKGTPQKRAKKLRFKSASAQAKAGTPVTLKLKPSKKTARKLKAAAKAAATITLSAIDAAGNTASRTLKVRLK